MKKVFYLFIFLSTGTIVHPLFGQKMFWSDMTPEDKEQALQISNQFFRYPENSNYDEIGHLLNDNEIFVGNGFWLGKKAFIDEIKSKGNPEQFSGLRSSAYTFDEFLNDHINNPLINRIFEVFDNHSILIHTGADNAGRILDCVMIIRKKRDSSWEITGVEGIISLEDSQASIDKSLFRVEKIPDGGIQIPIPKAFTKPQQINNQTIFYFEGKSGRDAVFQIMSDQLKAKIYYYTYKFVEHNNQQFKMSNLFVRYIPAGILYEYEVVDPEGLKNKGITVGIEKAGKVILIQYYSFIDVYQQIKKQVDYSLANIQY